MTSTDSLVKAIVIVVAALVAIPLVMMAVMMPMMGMAGWSHMGDHGMWAGTMGWGTWGLMMIVPLLVLLGAGYAVYRVVSGGTDETRDPALEELRQAYARGELSDEEFESRRARLKNTDEETTHPT